MVRVLTDHHYRGAKVLNSAFRVSDIITEGVSLTRLGMVDVVEFQAVAESIRVAAGANEVRGALALSAAELRQLAWDDDGTRKLCLFDDPVQSVDGERDNAAHCMAVSPRAIDEADALEIRQQLLDVFTEARYLHELWAA